MRSIVVEGPDNTGKTTLSRRLSEDLKFFYMKNTPQPSNVQLVELCCMYQYAWCCERPIVFDRITSISERVYGDKRCEPLLDHYWRMIKPNVILIFCGKELGEPTFDSYEDQDDKDKVIRDKVLIQSMYRRLMFSNNLWSPDLIYEGQTYGFMLKSVKSILEDDR